MEAGALLTLEPVMVASDEADVSDPVLCLFAGLWAASNEAITSFEAVRRI